MTKNESEGNVVQIRCIKLSPEQASGLWRKTSLYSKFTNSIPNSKYQKTFYQLKVSDDLRAEINCLLAANCSAASRWQQNSFNSLTEREGGRSAGKGRWIDRALCKQSCVCLTGLFCRPATHVGLYFTLTSFILIAPFHCILPNPFIKYLHTSLQCGI